MDAEKVGQLFGIGDCKYSRLPLKMFATQLFGWGMGTLLVSIRISMLFLATPLFGGVPIPRTARIILILGLASALAHNVTTPVLTSLPQLFLMCVHEAVIGGAIAAGLFIGFGVFHFGGRLLDMQIGFGVANLIDIASKNIAPLLGTLFSMTAVVVFFAIDGHLAMLRVVQFSIDKLPPGNGIDVLNIGALIAQFGTCFSFGFVIVAPVVACLFLIDSAVALMSRTMPQMNVFVMSMALKVLVGLGLLATIVPMAGNTMRHVFETIFSGWMKVLGNG
jgi:flagellar biosynthesis protein FliR